MPDAFGWYWAGEYRLLPARWPGCPNGSAAVTGTRARGIHARRGDGQRPPSARKSPAAGGLPVFTGPPGRRLRRMRQFGVGAGAVLLAWLIVMAVGPLGGPRAPVTPGGGANTGGFSGAGSGATGKVRPSPAGPAPARSPRPGSPPSASSPMPSGSPSPAVTNRASKAPPGRNRAPGPKHTHAA